MTKDFNRILNPHIGGGAPELNKTEAHFSRDHTRVAHSGKLVDERGREIGNKLFDSSYREEYGELSRHYKSNS